ncbi:MAG: hypothetical protein HYY18_02310 [Planctomycetes bacterium]|nr:hypothetical protein [Planctomycetota bacterium]
MRAAAILLAAAASALAQSGGDPRLPNPSRLGDEKAFEAQGLRFRPPEGCVTVEAEGPEGQRVITASRAVRVEGRDLPLGLEIEVFRDVDFLTYRRIVEGAQGALGLPPIPAARERKEGPPSWRVELPARDGTATHLLVFDGGDRVVSIHWRAEGAAGREFGALLAESADSLVVERRDPAPASSEPAVTWNRPGRGVELKYPEGWKEDDRDTLLVLANPTDRFETLAFGTLSGTVDQKEAEWEQARKDPASAARCLDSGRGTFAGRDSFAFTSRLDHQGIEVRSCTRLVAHRGQLVFVAFTARADRWEERKSLLEEVLATLRLED